MKKLLKWFRSNLGITHLEILATSHDNRLRRIENLVRVGADLNFKSPSWIVVCLRGKHDQDVVRFFELPDEEIAHLLEELKFLEKEYHIKPVFDAPSYIKKEYLKL